MSVGFSIDTSELAGLITTFDPLVEFNTEDLTPAVAMMGENQTRRRIEEEKTAPDGSPWLPNREGTSILLRTGRHLRDRVASSASGDVAEWGINWEFAHIHQSGAVIVPKNAKFLSFKLGGKRVRAKRVTIPARPIVGLSKDNEEEIKELVTDMLGLGDL